MTDIGKKSIKGLTKTAYEQVNQELNMAKAESIRLDTIDVDRIGRALQTIEHLTHTGELAVGQQTDFIMAGMKQAIERRYKVKREKAQAQVLAITDNDGLDFLEQFIELRKLLRTDRTLTSTNAFGKWASRHKNKLEAIIKHKISADWESTNGKA